MKDRDVSKTYVCIYIYIYIHIYIHMFTHIQTMLLLRKIDIKMDINSLRVTDDYDMELLLTLFCKSFCCLNKLSRCCLFLHIFLDKNKQTCFRKDLTQIWVCWEDSSSEMGESAEKAEKTLNEGSGCPHT